MTMLSREEINSKPFVSIEEFAFIMDYHRKTIERLVRNKKIPAVHMGKSVRIDFIKFKQEQK